MAECGLAGGLLLVLVAGFECGRGVRPARGSARPGNNFLGSAQEVRTSVVVSLGDGG